MCNGNPVKIDGLFKKCRCNLPLMKIYKNDSFFVKIKEKDVYSDSKHFIVPSILSDIQLSFYFSLPVTSFSNYLLIYMSRDNIETIIHEEQISEIYPLDFLASLRKNLDGSFTIEFTLINKNKDTQYEIESGFMDFMYDKIFYSYIIKDEIFNDCIKRTFRFRDKVPDDIKVRSIIEMKSNTGRMTPIQFEKEFELEKRNEIEMEITTSSRIKINEQFSVLLMIKNTSKEARRLSLSVKIPSDNIDYFVAFQNNHIDISIDECSLEHAQLEFLPRVKGDRLLLTAILEENGTVLLKEDLFVYIK
eukprot:GHVP01048616.1.p1 GENE.GHVP01048616.1~~GHVP01048616.1.p1  ORF type:complete len:304 (-),score=55.82 GHVP01048616.1:962-1873(-)